MTNREIKRRILSVRETVKITKAMHLISVAKMTRARASIPPAYAYNRASISLLSDVVASASEESIYLGKKGKRAGFLVIAGDKGLCGDYNQKVFEAALDEIKRKEESYVFTVGSVTRELFRKAGISVDVEFLNSAESPSPETAFSIASDVLYLFENDMLDEIYAVYTEGEKNPSEIRVKRLLPYSEREGKRAESIPNTDDLLRSAVVNYLSAFIYYAILSSSLAENIARIKAMSQATENGKKMIESLTAKYNRLRQEGITRALQSTSTSETEL